MTPLSKVIPQTKQSPSDISSHGRKPVRSVFKKGYFWLGLLLFAAFAIQEFGNFNWPWLAKLQANDVYKQISGFILAGYLLHQWRCSILRNEGLTQKAARLLNQHKMLGGFSACIFLCSCPA